MSEEVIFLKLKNNVSRRPINLFFAEIIIVLLFFSISGAVILRVFAAADEKSRKTAQLENVIIYAQSLAELYSGTGDIEKCAEKVWTNAIVRESTPEHVSIYLPDEKTTFDAYEQSEKTAAGELSTLKMVFSAEGSEIYTLSCKAYISGEESL